MTVTQTQFRDALFDADQPVPIGLQDGRTAPAGSRFSVYRNNVILSLTEALETAFPLVRKLLGGETFAKLAALYVRAHPPSSPLMMFYGSELPAFLDNFQPLAHIGYLSDCARLDLAQRQAYHAADSAPFDPSVLMGDTGETIHIAIAPAVRMIRSAWPLYDLWRYNTEPGAPKPQPVAQDVLISRPEFDPQIHLMPEGCTTWLESLGRGKTFGDALTLTLEKHPDFDLTSALSLALSASAFTTGKTKDPT